MGRLKTEDKRESEQWNEGYHIWGGNWGRKKYGGEIWR